MREEKITYEIVCKRFHDKKECFHYHQNKTKCFICSYVGYVKREKKKEAEGDKQNES